jgi:hypothetical protein
VSAQQGICSVIASQDRHAAVGASWCRAVRNLSPRLTWVRGSIAAHRDGSLDSTLLRRGLQAFADVGLEVVPVLELNLGPLATLNPNAGLGFKGDPLKSAFSDAYTNRVIALLNDLRDLCPARIILGNEFSLQAAANPTGSGHVIPQLALDEVADPLKSSALSPEAAAALTYHAAYWIARQCPRVTTIYPAAMSYDLQFRTSFFDRWVQGYLDDFYSFLTGHGLGPEMPFTGFLLNAEGNNLDAAYGDYVRTGVAQHRKDHAITGPFLLTEWGVPNGGPDKPINLPAIQDTARVMSGICEGMAFYAAQADGGYGCFRVGYQAGEIVPTAPLEWASLLPTILEALP